MARNIRRDAGQCRHPNERRAAVDYVGDFEAKAIQRTCCHDLSPANAASSRECGAGLNRAGYSQTMHSMPPSNSAVVQWYGESIAENAPSQDEPLRRWRSEKATR